MACALGDLQSASACSGYFAGNLNGGGGKIADAQYALGLIGYTWDGNVAGTEKIESFSGQSIAFSLPLTGINFISIHYGGGQGPSKGKGGATGFYKVESPFVISRLATLYGSLSNAVLYAKPASGPGGDPGDGGGAGSAVPEPAIWAQLILGFGLIGFARRRQAVSVAA